MDCGFYDDWGKQLFKWCIQKAKDLGAAKIYISANFSEETQALEAAEPYDRQMEYVL
jgi:hypothetical protein